MFWKFVSEDLILKMELFVCYVKIVNMYYVFVIDILFDCYFVCRMLIYDMVLFVK